MLSCVSLRAREDDYQGKKAGGSTRRTDKGDVSQTLSRPVLCSMFCSKLFIILLLYDNLALKMSTAECCQYDDSHIAGSE